MLERVSAPVTTVGPENVLDPVMTTELPLIVSEPVPEMLLVRVVAAVTLTPPLLTTLPEPKELPLAILSVALVSIRVPVMTLFVPVKV